ncbi:hypothetical protein N1027_14630 [Herbiconiux sp. CPCC 205763]|uniref:Immunity protein 63 domain-containing protein n=1 Tax=Herbiconiux aconitum TaxID=2970913 RepID=A0ABT2GWU4_9MICO|nr:hypothetical protein [Herbiconiux aconitum]MCS5719371.1 hypothetical protein [Herbiconiux aconitum]
MLKFETTARDEFQYLAEDFGFEIVKSNDYWVIYASESRIVYIMYGRHSRSVCVDLGRFVTEPDGTPVKEIVPLFDLVALRTDHFLAAQRNPSAKTANELSRGLHHLAVLLQEHAHPLLTDGDGIFDELAAESAERYQRFVQAKDVPPE